MRGLLLIALMTTALAACGAADRSRDGELLRAELIEARTQIETNRVALENLGKELRQLRLASAGAEWAVLDPAAGPSYRLVSTGVAPLLVSFQDSSPVGDGTRIKMQLGNISSGAFEGAKVTVNYNTRAPQDQSAWPSWRDAMRSTEVELTERLAAGSWNTVQVSLPGIKPEELGYLEVKIGLNSVYLSAR